ncbi:DUF2635 domain-containing protein [Agrobacterium sp. T29]|uniref:DUF2635 domain-containing protein n=1 Tax=Agrobacterium sp. T29 TaxID=2580515 RepID=UPI00143D735C|nr:hypothetical protein [Agrobacterium sp. T29]
MATTKTLIAAEGRTVLLLDGTEWPKEGLPDPNTLFTRRRIADGDLIEKPADAAQPAAPASSDAPQLTQIEEPAETAAETKRSTTKKSEGDK